jgi:hypothetical protein
MADNDYLTLGRGKVYFDQFKPGTKETSGALFLGNCTEFNLNVDFEELTHMDSTGGFKEEDANAITSRTVGGAITFDKMKPRNLAYFFMGTSTILSQSSGSSTKETFTGVVLGARYQLGVSNAAPTGVRSVSNVVVEDQGGTGSTYTLNTDYTVDAERGIVTILETGTIAADADLDITYDNGATSRTQVISGQAQIEGAIRFEADNPEGKDIDYLLPYVKLRPNGDLALIGDDWMQASLNVKALRLPDRSTVYADGQPYV